MDKEILVNEVENRIGKEHDTDGKNENAGGEEKSGRGYNGDKPPEDDCCPICFGEFKVPCKANCGHWFCGSCVLQLWKYRSRPRRCKCPFCSSAISKLTPETSAVNEIEFEVVQVLENIQHYNRFYVKGAKGFFLILAFYLRKHGPFLHLYTWRLLQALLLVVVTSPAFLKRALFGLIRNPERIELNLQRVRLIACTLSLLLHLYHGFIPSGDVMLKVTKTRMYVDCASLILVIFPYVLIVCKTWIHILWLKFRIWQVRREVDALRAHNAILREQEAALLDRADALRGQEVALEENGRLLEKAKIEAPSQVEAEAEAISYGKDEASLLKPAMEVH